MSDMTFGLDLHCPLWPSESGTLRASPGETKTVKPYGFLVKPTHTRDRLSAGAPRRARGRGHSSVQTRDCECGLHMI